MTDPHMILRFCEVFVIYFSNLSTLMMLCLHSYSLFVHLVRVGGGRGIVYNVIEAV